MTLCSNQRVPLISVIIPAYNAEKFIERTLSSVLQQTYENIEVLVINDESSDRTVEIVESMKKLDSRIRLFHQPNSGVAAARNLGVFHASGEFIAPIDSDDIWHKENLERQLECFLNSDRSVGLVYSWSFNIDELDRPLKGFSASRVQGRVSKTLLCHNFIGNSSATLIRRECFETVGQYDCTLKTQGAQGCEDLDLYLRISEYYQFRVVPHFLVGYRKIVNSMSCDYQKMATSHDLVISHFSDKHPEIPKILYGFARSSLYIYFAKQSHREHNYKITLFWLRKAFKVDWLTPMFRPDCYQLLFGVFVGFMGTHLRVDFPYTLNAFTSEFPGICKSEENQEVSTSDQKLQNISSIPNEKSLAVLLKVFAANMIHWLSSFSLPLQLVTR
jgi:glycosyltransferase involved in cell wall biosynthesis